MRPESRDVPLQQLFQRSRFASFGSLVSGLNLMSTMADLQVELLKFAHRQVHPLKAYWARCSAYFVSVSCRNIPCHSSFSYHLENASPWLLEALCFHYLKSLLHRHAFRNKNAMLHVTYASSKGGRTRCMADRAAYGTSMARIRKALRCLLRSHRSHEYYDVKASLAL